MKSQDKNQLQKRINSIFRSAVAKQTYGEGISQIQRLLKREARKGLSGITLEQLGFLYDHAALQKRDSAARRAYEQQALSYYRRAIRLNQKDPFSMWGIGRIWWHRKDKRALLYAQKAYRLAKICKIDFGPFGQNIAFIYDEIFEKYAFAERWYLRALKEEKRKTVRSYANLVQFYVKHGKDAQARRFARKMNLLFKKTPLEFQASRSGRRLSQIISKAFK